jgi:predicted transcriptional regulator
MQIMTQRATHRETRVLESIQHNPSLSSKEIHEMVKGEMSYATLKRTLQKLISENLITPTGKGKGTKYQISEAYEILRPIDMDEYYQIEIDTRKIKVNYNFSLIEGSLRNISIFTQAEINLLNSLQNEFTQKISMLSEEEYKTEMERLAIDLSWKSSQIEGNTYSLLETERLLKERETAGGKTPDEATMLLNHKAALDFIIENPTYLAPLKPAGIEDIHSILMKNLDVDRNIRKRAVGISGTNYKPLDNEFQIREALQAMCEIVNHQGDGFAKALLVLVLISYIQPFADGNKRTGRIISNAMLMQENLCPISFRTVNSIDYKKAMLIFYEQNNISACKKIFMEQFEFAVKTYF